MFATARANLVGVWLRSHMIGTCRRASHVVDPRALADEPLLLAEHQPAHVRVQPVRDHQFEPPRRPAIERQVDAAGIGSP
jgi:hypothetical protein